MQQCPDSSFFSRLVVIRQTPLPETAGRDWLFLGSGIRCRYSASKKTPLLAE